MELESKSSMRVYVWDRCFLMQAGSFFLGHRSKAHKRLSATIIVATRRPFSMEIAGQPAREYQGVLIAPNVARSSLEAKDSALTILDAGITTAAYSALEPCLAPGQARTLTDDELARIRPLLADSVRAAMTCGQVLRIFDAVIAALGGKARRVEHDPRIQRVMRLVEELPLDELSVTLLARAAGLSPSRLRALFQGSLGCGPAQYMRWVNAWKVIRQWEKGKRFTDLAHEMGFHDLAHIDHAVKELFGLNPTALTTAQGVSFHKCG